MKHPPPRLSRFGGAFGVGVLLCVTSLLLSDCGRSPHQLGAGVLHGSEAVTALLESDIQVQFRTVRPPEADLEQCLGGLKVAQDPVIDIGDGPEWAISFVKPTSESKIVATAKCLADRPGVMRVKTPLARFTPCRSSTKPSPGSIGACDVGGKY